MTNEIVFSLNRGYMKEELPRQYLVFVDRPMAKTFSSEIPFSTYEGVFTSYGLYRDKVIYGDNVVPIKGTHGIELFSRDITIPTYGGGTVTYLAMQIAYYMGITKLYIVGMDHFSEPTDVEHFMDNYFGASPWSNPKLDKIETAYEMAVKAYKEDGREIWNASSKTKLSIIPRTNYEELWK